MRVTFDPAKRLATFEERGLDFEDAALVFAGPTLEVEDVRMNYGETRIVCYGYLKGWSLSATRLVAAIDMYLA